MVIDPDDDFNKQKILSSCDINQVSYLIGIAILMTSWVGSLIALLILNFDTMYTPIYQSNIGHHRHFKHNLLGLQHKLAIWSIGKCFWKHQLLARFSFSQKPTWNSSCPAFRAAFLGVLHFESKVCPKSTLNHSLNHNRTFGGFKCMTAINSIGFGYDLGASQHLIVIHNGIFRLCVWGLQMHDNDT